MSWFKRANEQNEKAIVSKIKNILRSHSFFRKLMSDYHIPPEDIDNHLRIVFDDLGEKYAEGNGEEIRLSRRLLDANFFRQKFHFVVHEFYHWVKRRSEALFYFNDDEEIQSFTLAIVWELMAGKSNEEIAQEIYPIIAGHFQQPVKAHELFAKMLAEAERLLSVYQDESPSVVV